MKQVMKVDWSKWTSYFDLILIIKKKDNKYKLMKSHQLTKLSASLEESCLPCDLLFAYFFS